MEKRLNLLKTKLNSLSEQNKWLLIKVIALFIFLIEAHMLYAYFVDSDLARANQLL